jgi:hypothetical protein
MHHDLEVRRHVFQNLALVRADAAEPGAAAGRAGAGRFVLDPLARQMRGQWLAAARRRAGRSRLVRRRRRLFRLVLGLVRLELADQQLELLDPLRRAPVARPLQERQLGLQLLDMQRLGIELGLQPGREHPERVRIGGQRGRGE